MLRLHLNWHRREAVVRAIVAICGIGAVLAGCAGHRLEQRLDSFVGGSLQSAISQLGDPYDRQMAPGDVVYRWNYHSLGLLPVAVEVGTTNVLAGSKRSSSDVLVSEQYVQMQLGCTVELNVDSNDWVRNFRWLGDPMPCMRHLQLRP
jgi:hypothetical protein